MPMSPKQRTVIANGAAACQSCAEYAAMLRRIGFPDEAAEQRIQATAATYAEVPGVLAEFDQKMRQEKANGAK